ncbi:hypothetical protein STEG23_006314, partial [Scotinomys teguina]
YFKHTRLIPLPSKSEGVFPFPERLKNKKEKWSSKGIEKTSNGVLSRNSIVKSTFTSFQYISSLPNTVCYRDSTPSFTDCQLQKETKGVMNIQLKSECFSC